MSSLGDIVDKAGTACVTEIANSHNHQPFLPPASLFRLCFRSLFFAL